MQTAFVIAEVGSNHCGSRTLARELIEASAKAGADAVKFQVFKRADVWTEPDARPAFTEIDEDFVMAAAEICYAAGVEFMASVFNPEDVKWLSPYVLRWKIASPEANKPELLRALRETGKQVLASTGVSDPPADTIPMLCVSAYPAEASAYGIREWLYGASRPYVWGISDHTVGCGASAAAVALGARFVEKHVALAAQPPSPDDGPHALRPEAFAAFVRTIREASAATNGRFTRAELPLARRRWLG